MEPRDSCIWHDDPEVWRFLLGRYLVVFVPMSLAWEVVQLPFYTLATEAPAAYILYAVVHCTLGDVLVGVGAFLAALVASRARALAAWRWRRIGTTAVAFGVVYTAVSEWINAVLRMTWTYSEWMPVTPLVPIGASPLLQWIIVPIAAMIWSRRIACRRAGGVSPTPEAVADDRQPGAASRNRS